MTTKAKTSLFFGEMGGMIFVGCVGRKVERLEFSRPKLPGAYFKVIVQLNTSSNSCQVGLGNFEAEFGVMDFTLEYNLLGGSSMNLVSNLCHAHTQPKF